MNKKVKEITSDAIFVALLTVIIILMKYAFSMLESSLLLIISAFIGIYYHKEKPIRIITVSIAIILISFLYFDFTSILIFILPGIIVGFISHYLLKILLNLPYYISTTFIYFIIHSIVEIIYAKLILNLNFINYLNSGMEFPPSLVEKMGASGLLILFFSYNLFISLMESFIIRRGVFIFEMIKNKNKNKKRLK